MVTARLRVFPYQPELPEPRAALPEPQAASAVPIRLAELYPLLAEAHRNRHVWLRDFADDELMVSPDLLEVIQVFSRMQAVT